jgi:ABC-type sugar transport system ATPase subunit
MAAAVEHVEVLGHETLVHALLVGGGRVIARMDEVHRFASGHPVFVCPDSSRLHFFDVSGRRCAP